MQLKSKPSQSQPLITSEEERPKNLTLTSRQKAQKFILFLIKGFLVCSGIGILLIFALIIFSSLLLQTGGCGNTAKGSEAKQYLAFINRGQQAFLIENNRFSPQIDSLGIGIKTQTNSYNYSIISTKDAAFSYAKPRPEAQGMSNYVGAVFLVPSPSKTNNTDLLTTKSIICQVSSREGQLPPKPILINDVPTCVKPSINIYQPIKPHVNP